MSKGEPSTGLVADDPGEPLERTDGDSLPGRGCRSSPTEVGLAHRRVRRHPGTFLASATWTPRAGYTSSGDSRWSRRLALYSVWLVRAHLTSLCRAPSHHTPQPADGGRCGAPLFLLTRMRCGRRAGCSGGLGWRHLVAAHRSPSAFRCSIPILAWVAYFTWQPEITDRAPGVPTGYAVYDLGHTLRSFVI